MKLPTLDLPRSGSKGKLSALRLPCSHLLLYHLFRQMKILYTLRMEYKLMVQQFDALFSDESDLLCILSNASALIKEAYEEKVNWAGFYLLDESGVLNLGPFQGKVACMHLYPNKGVCQKAVSTNDTVIVADVHEFQDHIACDAASNSEIVVPIHKGDAIWGVLDIDSPFKDTFHQEDAEALEEIVKLLETKL